MSGKKSKDNIESKSEYLEKFEININEFGEIDSSIKKEDINKFLNKFHQDKKIQESEDKTEEE